MLKMFQRWIARLLAVFRKPDAPQERIEPPSLEPLTTSGVSENGRHHRVEAHLESATVLPKGSPLPPQGGHEPGQRTAVTPVESAGFTNDGRHGIGEIHPSTATVNEPGQKPSEAQKATAGLSQDGRHHRRESQSSSATVPKPGPTTQAREGQRSIAGSKPSGRQRGLEAHVSPATAEPGPANVAAAGLTPSPQAQADAAQTFTGNRKERRAQRAQARGWERERRKRDVFVTPKGPTPRVIPRTAPVHKEVVPPPAKEQGDGNYLIDGEDGYVYPERELYGEFAFRDTILDQLDRYWVYLRRMQKNDPESYGFYRQVGANIVPLITWFMHNGVRDKHKDDKDDTPITLSAWWHTNRPTFGCITYAISSKLEQEELGKTFPGEPDTRMWLPKFLYFTKWKNPPPTVQMCSGGDIYSMTVWWDRPFDQKMAKRMKGGVPHEYAVFISRDGEDVHVLPMCRTEYIEAASRKNGLRKFDIPQRRWSIPKEFTEWAQHHGCDPNTFLSRLFIDAANRFEHLQYSMIRIAVSKDDMTATFSVDIKRVPYFFQDRDVTLTQSGVKQPVFHIVRPHQRRTGAMVRMHFRGLKDFEWAGYKVKITVPGRDHFLLQDIDVGMMDEFWDDGKEEHMSNPEFGTFITEHINKGTGATHPHKPKHD